MNLPQECYRKGIAAEVIAHALDLLAKVRDAELPEPEITPQAHSIAFEWGTRNTQSVIEIGRTRYNGFTVDREGRKATFKGRIR